MSMLSKELLEELILFAGELGISALREFDPSLLVPEERIRLFCVEDKCGNYGKNYMCPPYVGPIGQIKERLAKYKTGILFQYSEPCDVKKNRKEVEKTKIDFHKRVLQLEDFLNDKGLADVWGLIGGTCGLCTDCYAKLREPCPYPGSARPSLEAMGIDLIALLKRFSLDAEFHSDRITWTGCLLFNQT
ncbi:MAG: DUF2284 domain-containing protein [Pseudomonadota bacterium]